MITQFSIYNLFYSTTELLSFLVRIISLLVTKHVIVGAGVNLLWELCNPINMILSLHLISQNFIFNEFSI